MKFFDTQKAWGSHLFCPPERGREQKINILLYSYLSLEWKSFLIKGNTTELCWIVLSVKMDCLLFLWYHSVLNIGISLVVMKYYLISVFLCYRVDPHRKIPIACNNSNYFREKDEEMLLQVKLSLTVKSKTSVTVGWFFWGFWWGFF